MADWPVFVVPVLALPAGYGLACLRKPKWRSAGLIVLLTLPLALYTLVLASAEPADPGFLAWWLTGLLILAGPLTIWLFLAVIGYSIGRALRGDLP